MHCTRQAACLVTVLLVRPFAERPRLLRPLLTSRSGSSPSPFQAQGEISPGKNAILHRTAAAFTSPTLGHESFAVHCLLALLGAASDAVRVPRLAVYAPRFLPTLGRPHAVALRFARCGQLGRGLAPPRSRPCWAQSSRGRGHPRRPLTPPYVRFRIRRFNNTLESAGGCPPARPAPFASKYVGGRPAPCASPLRSTTAHAR